MSEVTRYDSLILENIQYDKPDSQGNVYFGPMYYDLNPLLLQSSRLQVKEIRNDTKQKYLVLQTDTQDFKFYDKLVQLDDHNLEQTYQKSEEWFSKELPMDVLEGMYRRITQPFKKDEIPTIEFKLSFHNNNLQTKIYNQSNEPVELESIAPGSTIIAMVHVRGLKFLKQTYYCDVFLSQIKLVKDHIVVDPSGCLIEDEKVEVDQDDQYDYEILDEEIIQKNEEITDVDTKILDIRTKIKSDQEELSRLEEKLANLK